MIEQKHFNNETGSVITVGTFDGVHRGHRAILNRMRDYASATNSAVVVVTFDPHPQIVLNQREHPIRLLNTASEKKSLLHDTGVDNVVVIPFTKEFALTPPEAFVGEYLADELGMKAIFVGYDHMFGKDRTGNEQLLDTLATSYAYEVHHVEAVSCCGVTVSSSAIRNALEAADVNLANEMLGYHYRLAGTVVAGEGRGRTLQMPTANIEVNDPYKLIPANGVYVVSALLGSNAHGAVANIGIRPTFDTESESVTEVHLLEFDGDLYGKEITLVFHAYIRPELKFDTVQALRSRMTEDVADARKYFHENSKLVSINTQL